MGCIDVLYYGEAILMNVRGVTSLSEYRIPAGEIPYPCDMAAHGSCCRIAEVGKTSQAQRTAICSD